jgi:hypothetical protein
LQARVEREFVKRTKKEHAIRQKALQNLAEDKKREQKLALPRKTKMLTLTCANDTRASNAESTTIRSPVKESVLVPNETPTSNTISLRNIAQKENIAVETVCSESMAATTQSSGDNEEGMTTTRIAQDSSRSKKNDRIAVRIEGWIVMPQYFFLDAPPLSNCALYCYSNIFR